MSKLVIMHGERFTPEERKEVEEMMSYMIKKHKEKRENDTQDKTNDKEE